jgi:hypothetical protein
MNLHIIYPDQQSLTRTLNGRSEMSLDKIWNNSEKAAAVCKLSVEMD